MSVLPDADMMVHWDYLPGMQKYLELKPSHLKTPITPPQYSSIVRAQQGTSFSVTITTQNDRDIRLEHEDVSCSDKLKWDFSFSLANLALLF